MFGAFAIIDAFKSKEDNWTYSTLQEINNWFIKIDIMLAWAEYLLPKMERFL
jgi:hypothetical protein